jgi:Nucleolar protein,Nop52.
MVDNCITEFTDDDFMRIWKGLFYCMWMADKPLVQVLVPGEGGCSVNGPTLCIGAFPYLWKAPVSFFMCLCLLPLSKCMLGLHWTDFLEV